MIFKTKNQQGFSLIETLVALTILTVATSYVIGVFPKGLNSSLSALEETTAVNLAQAKVEEVISTPYDEISTGVIMEGSLSSIGADFSRYKRITTVSYVDSDLNPSISDLGLKKLKVDVVWLDGLKKSFATTTIYTLITPL